MNMDDDNWLTVGKAKKVKSGENKALNIDKVSEEEDENSKLLASLSKKSNEVLKKDNAVGKKTQIPVKIKPHAELKIQQKAKKNTESPSRAPAFKSLQGALNALNLNELRNLLEATRLQFNNDMIMLKTAFTFLNEKLRLEKVEDSLLFDKPLDYPNNIIPNDLRFILQALVQKCNHDSLLYFFHNILQMLCEDLNKSRNFVGHLILLQQIAQFYPEVCIGNLASTVILRNSYQNQPSICLSLFWALGTSGSCDTTIGLKIWMEIISSVVNVKSYTKFAFDYLHKMLSASEKTPPLKITIEEYKVLADILLSTDQKLKLKNLQKIKAECVGMLSAKFIKSIESTKVESLFLLLLNYSKRSPEMFVREMIKCIELHPEECLNIWRLNFHTYRRPNLFFFSYVDNNIKVAENLFDNNSFVTFIENIDNQKYIELAFAKDIPTKMTDNKKQKKQKKSSGESSCGSSCCKWFFGSFLLFSAIAGLIAYDTNVLHGGKFEESSVGRVLKQTGALPHVENAWFVSLKYSARGYKWAEVQAPIAYSKTSTFLEPYGIFAKDLGLTVLNGVKKGWESTKIYTAEKTPVVISFVDKYVPGLGQKIHDVAVNTFKGLCSLTCNFTSSSLEFFKTKVFIGQLSPENLGKALNSTTQRALSYYSWFNEKVNLYAKLK